jgi:type I restriction enzyme, S subunit
MAGEASAGEAATYPRGFSRNTDWKWPMVPARELVALNYGRALKADIRSPGKVPVFGTNGQCGFHDAALSKGPGLILGRKGQGPLGVEWCNKDFWVIDTAYYASTLTPEVDLKYLYHLVKYVGLNHLKDGTSNPTLSRDTFGAQLFPLPPLSVQKSIASVLGALDDKIELNRRMNATLEGMARALFQSWFVDFDPVRAKLGGRQSAGLDAVTADFFPGSFQDSPIGPVPKGWKVDRFDAHITADRGLSYKGEGLRDDHSGLPMHNLNSVYEGGGYKHEGLKYYAGEYREKHLLEPGDMIVANTEQGFEHLLIGHAAIVPRSYGAKGLFSHHIYRVRHKPTSPFSPHYLVELFNNRRWHYWISGFSNGTTINMLPKDALEMPMLVVPPVELVKKFTLLAEAAHIQVEENKQQSRALATLRDTLLPKLLSGELSTEHLPV